MNGQAKIDFEKQCCGIIPANQTELYAYYIEWFESVEIIPDVMPILDNPLKWMPNTFSLKYDYSMNENDFEYYEIKSQATEKALEKAIILYNEKFKEND